MYVSRAYDSHYNLEAPLPSSPPPPHYRRGETRDVLLRLFLMTGISEKRRNHFNLCNWKNSKNTTITERSYSQVAVSTQQKRILFTY